MEREGHRSLRERFGKPRKERLYPKVDISPVLDQLHVLRIGYPITFSNNGVLERIGHVVPLDPVTDLICMNNGIMQLRTAESEGLNRQYPFSRIAATQENTSFDTAEEAGEFVLTYDRRAVRENVITNTNRSHKKEFKTALIIMEELIDQHRASQQETIELLHAVVPQEADSKALAEADERIKTEMATAIDALAEERLGKAFVLKGDGSVVGYVLPVPFEENETVNETTRKLILLKDDGKVFVVDVPDDSRVAGAYRSDTKELEIDSPEALVSSIHSPHYSLVTSNEPGGNSEILKTSYESALTGLEEKRTARRTRLAAEESTRSLFAAVLERKTAPTIEEKARELLGRNFLGVEAVKAVEAALKRRGKDINFLIDPVPPIPYTERDLEIAKERGESLVLHPQLYIGELGVEEQLTVGSFMHLFGAELHGIDEPYMSDPNQITLGWALSSNTILEGTKSKTWEQQQQELPKYAAYLKNKGATAIDVRARTALEVIWVNYAFQILHNASLDRETYERTSSLYDSGRHVHMRMQNGITPFLDYLFPADDDIGMCTVR